MNGHLIEVASLKEGEWSSYTLMAGRMVMLKKWCLMEGAWSCYRGGQYNGGRMLLMEVASLNEGEWSCYRGGHFKEGRMVVIEVASNGGQLASNGGGMVMLERRPV